MPSLVTSRMNQGARTHGIPSYARVVARVLDVKILVLRRRRKSEELVRNSVPVRWSNAQQLRSETVERWDSRIQKWKKE